MVLSAVLTILSQTGCKENTIANTRLAPDIDNINTFGDTLNAVTKTYFDDTLETSFTIGGIAINHALGTINADPYFGTTNSSIYFQVIPIAGPNVVLDRSVDHFDSAVLILPYSGFTYGDSVGSYTQTYTAYMLGDTMNTTTAYYSYNTKPLGAVLGSVTTNVNSVRDSVLVDGVNQAPHLRIRLDTNAISTYLLNNTDIQDANSYAAFLTAFPGICVKATNTNAVSHAMPYFRIDPSGEGLYTQATVAIYYHDITPGAVDTPAPIQLSFDENYCAHFNNIYRNYRNYPVNQLFNAYKQNPNVSDTVIALQNQPGAALDLKIYGIKKIPTSVINRAELDISVVGSGNPSADATFFGPTQLYPLGIDSNGFEYTIADRYPLTSTSPLSVLDGYPHTYTYNMGLLSITTYAINIPRELQAAVVAKRDTVHLHINGTQDYYGAYRIVAGGNSLLSNRNKNYQVNLKVVYTKPNN